MYSSAYMLPDVVAIEENQQLSKQAVHNEDEAHWHALMCLAQQGDPEAYRQLLEEIRSYLHSQCNRFLGHWSSHEDCIQECLIAIHKARHTFDPRHALLPWVKAIARNKAIDHLRRRSRRWEREIKKVVSEQAEETCAIATLENQMLLKQLLSHLSPLYREAIGLTKLHCMSDKQSAERLNISVAALKVRVHRGLKELQGVARTQARLAEKRILYPLGDSERIDR